MNNKFKALRKEIIENDEFECSELFAGANLIITQDKNRKYKSQDVLVITNNAKELSWLVFKLKDLFQEELDHINKFTYYPHIGNLINKAIHKDLNLKEQMLFVIDNIGEFKNKST